jgi:glycosyltransferase involved in cell wall biosynthesis
MVTYSYYFTDARIKGYVNYLGQLGHRVDVLTLKEPHHAEVCKHVSDFISIHYLTDKYIGKAFVPYILSYLKFFIAATLMLTRLWMRKGFHIIHVNNIPNFIVFTTVLPRIFGVKVILDMHDIASQLYVEKFGNNKVVARLLALEEIMSAKYANFIICADDFQKEFLIRKHKLPLKKIKVILNLPDIRIFHSLETRPTDLKEGSFNIIYHGTITYRLGIDLILRAIARVKDQINVKLFLYGSGDYMNECQSMITDLGLDNIVFASKKFYKVEDLPKLLCGMHLGVIGNRISSATKHMLPVKLMEYMALKIPVVVPNMPNIRHYFSEKCICYYEPENIDDLSRKIIMLVHSSERRSDLANCAYDFIRLNNWDKEFGKYMDILGTLIKQ